MTHDKSKTRIVVLGAGYAGLLATLRLTGKVDPNTAEITLINGSERFVERIRLHQLASDQKLRRFEIRGLLRGEPVNFVRGIVTALEPDAKMLQLKTENGCQQIGFDYLLYALGSSAQKSGIKGLSKYAFSVGRPEDAAALRRALAESKAGARIAVVGGGLTGIETATEIAESYPDLRVSVWTDGQIGPGLSERGRAYIRKTFHDFGIDHIEGLRVAEVRPRSLLTSEGDEILHDVCIWAGSFSVSELARDAGLAVNARGQALVDPYLRSVSDNSIYVAGDSAGFVEDPGAPIRMACATAMPMGAQAADNLAAAFEGKPEEPFRFAYALQCISLGRRRGLVQLVREDDQPKDRIFTGRTAAWIKELICRSTIYSLRLERMLPGTYRWPGRHRSARAEAAVVPQN